MGFVVARTGAAGCRSLTAGDFLEVIVAQLAFVFAAHMMCLVSLI
jgi:hypothetical protein